MNNQQHQQNMQQTGSGLTRYRSAPSSYFASFLNDGGFGTDDLDQLFNTSPEAQRTFSRLSSNSDTIHHQQEQESQRFANSSAAQFQTGSQLPPRSSDKPPVPTQHKLQRQQSNDYSSVTQMMYQNLNSESANPVTTDGSYSNKFVSSNSMMPMKMESGSGSGLIRHSSSPAGLFANIDIEKEFGTIRGMGNFGAGSSSNASRFNSGMDFSSRHASSSGMMAPISEIGSKGIGETNDEDHGNDGDFISGFPMNSWDDDSAMLPDNFLAGIDETDNKPFSNEQNNEAGKPPRTMLSHHLSLPKSSAELSAMEKLLQDSVPCKIRAKRGCATHPRSIAERVRRTKISERMRKLQELVPNMEKQTNTSDMLDLAVDYIKDLQRQVKTLSDTSAKCTCSANKEKI